jgi:sodium-dependent dicarboxylate transporter 2/3/5
LDTVIAQGLAGIGGVPVIVLVLIVASVVVFLTEVTSNTATATVFMPIMASLGLTLGISPLALMATAALAASFAFMLPVATPPNAVVFGSGYVTITQMSRIGLWLNLLGIIALVVLTYFWLPIALSLAG